MKSASMKFGIAGIVTAMILTALFFSLYNETRIAQGSTIQGNDYQATTTAGNSVYGSITASKVIKSTYGSLGTVVVTGANTGVVNFYDATTTDITKRTNNTATATILVASLPASLAAGDYVFDTALSWGLYVDLVSGTMPTTTIAFR